MPRPLCTPPPPRMGVLMTSGVGVTVPHQDPISPPVLWTPPEPSISGWALREAGPRRELGCQRLAGDLHPLRGQGGQGVPSACGVHLTFPVSPCGSCRARVGIRGPRSGPSGQALAVPEALRCRRTDRENQHPESVPEAWLRAKRSAQGSSHLCRAQRRSALRPAWREVLWPLGHQTTAGLGRAFAASHL